MNYRHSLVIGLVLSLVGIGVFSVAKRAPAQDNAGNQGTNCSGLPTEAQLKQYLNSAPGSGGTVGGLFNGTRMWAAVVNREARICGYTTSTDDPSQVWPGSQAIAKSKAYTANAFSLDDLALSSARLYTFTQPGHSLWSLGQSNLFESRFLASPDGQGGGKGQLAGGLIFFGGGVPLYKDGKIIGGLGISGDTSCADHEIAKRVRHLANLDPTHLGGMLADDIIYSPPEAASVFAHPLCINTWRNGVSLGNERPASY